MKLSDAVNMNDECWGGAVEQWQCVLGLVIGRRVSGVGCSDISWIQQRVVAVEQRLVGEWQQWCVGVERRQFVIRQQWRCVAEQWQCAVGRERRCVSVVGCGVISWVQQRVAVVERRQCAVGCVRRRVGVERRQFVIRAERRLGVEQWQCVLGLVIGRRVSGVRLVIISGQQRMDACQSASCSHCEMDAA